MKQYEQLRAGLKMAGSKIAQGTALALVTVGSAMATTSTAADTVIAKVNEGGADGVKVAIAVVIAVWGITAVYMMGRKR